MPSSDLNNLFNLYELPAGRRVHALRRLHAIVKDDPNLTDLATQVASAMDTSTNTLDLRTRWAESKNEKTTYPAEVLVLNQEHDQIFASLERICTGMAQGMLPSSPQAIAATRLLSSVFALGLAPLTQKDFVEQRETTNVWLKRFDSEFSQDLATLGVVPMISRLRTVNDSLGKLIDQSRAKSGVAWDTVQQSDTAGQQQLLQVVAAIVGRFSGRHPGDNDKRAALLEPILEQNEKVADMYRKRARVTDVDPETGKETEPVVG
jgi:hypothetical protein